MDGAIPEKGSSAQKRLSMSFLVSLVVLCARHASRVSKKFKAKPSRKQTHLEDFLRSPKLGEGGGGYDWSPLRASPARSPLRARPKELLTSLSNKAMTLVTRKRTRFEGGGAVVTAGEKAAAEEEEEEEYGVWQRAILMGDKCQPLDFSGVIYYDCHGRQLKEVPLRSPRASPLPNFLTRGSPLNPTVTKNLDN